MVVYFFLLKYYITGTSAVALADCRRSRHGEIAVFTVRGAPQPPGGAHYRGGDDLRRLDLLGGEGRRGVDFGSGRIGARRSRGVLH